MKRFELLDDESVILEKPIHWKNYLLVSILFLTAIIIFSIRAIVPNDCIINLFLGEGERLNQETSAIIGKLELIATSFLVFFLIGRVTEVFFIRYYVTNKRIIMTRGFLTIKVTDMLIRRCETVKIKQSIYERIFKCADILCMAPGSMILLDDVTDAEQFKKAIMNQIARQKDASTDNKD